MKQIIVIHGANRCGKDTLADYIVKKYNFKKISFAEPIKDIVDFLSSFLSFKSDSSESDLKDKKRPHYEYIGKSSKLLWIDIINDKINNTSENIVIPDLRFNHELEFLNKLDCNVIFIKLEREGKNKIYDVLNIENVFKNNGSENDLFKEFDEFYKKK